MTGATGDLPSPYPRAFHDVLPRGLGYGRDRGAGFHGGGQRQGPGRGALELHPAPGTAGFSTEKAFVKIQARLF